MKKGLTFAELRVAYMRAQWNVAWRNLRKSMRDPAELAWRLRADFKHAEPTDYTWFHNQACTAMYNRSMPQPSNQLQKRLTIFHKGVWRVASEVQNAQL